MKTERIAFVCLVAASFAITTSPRLNAAANGLVWEKDSQEYTTKPGERYSRFTFWFTNVSPKEISINSAKSSCFCTVAKLPRQPWPIPSGSNGSIEVTMDLAGKNGTVFKAVTVDSTSGPQALMVRTTITPALAQGDASMQDADRMKNMQLALADRQAVFTKAECASCHADPAKGKTGGAELYAAVCSNCHDSEQRATSVPDLRALPHPTDANHWRTWITHGRAGSMMPAFAQAEGGPLSAQQIAALTDYLARTIHGNPVAGANSRPANAGAFTVPVAR
jgi:mono/diheme cytochrome c family protein